MSTSLHGRDWWKEVWQEITPGKRPQLNTSKSLSGHSWMHPIAKSRYEVCTKHQRSAQVFPPIIKARYVNFLVHDNDNRDRLITGRWPFFSASFETSCLLIYTFEHNFLLPFVEGCTYYILPFLGCLYSMVVHKIS